MKATIYSVILLVIVGLWAAVGYSYAAGSIDPVYIEVPVPVEVPAVKVWDETLVLGVTSDGHIVEAPESDEGYVYILTVHFNKGDSFNELTVWLPFGEDSFAGIALQFPSSDYAVDVRKVQDTTDLPMPEPDTSDEF